THRAFFASGWGFWGVGLAAMVVGCAALYPTLSTPVRGAVSVDQYEPPPPKDILFVTIKSARIPVKTRDGRNWDQVGGHAPDPFAVLFVDDKEVLRTPVVSNTLQPKWPTPEPVNLKVPSRASVRIEVWDDNALVSHPICNERVHRIEEAVDLGELEIPCESGATVVLSVEPPKARLGIGLFYEMRGKEAYVLRVVAASPAGRAGLLPEDQILSADGRAVSNMIAGELQGIFNSKSKVGVELEVKGRDGERRKLTLMDEPMYPVKNEGIELLTGKNPD
ncbi:MAG: PDZ domain-containing protein, partial [Myxococcales bacterium]